MVDHHVELAPREGPKTAFSTKQGHWEYRRLPFSVKKGPCYVSKTDEFCIVLAKRYTYFVYLDDGSNVWVIPQQFNVINILVLHAACASMKK